MHEPNAGGINLKYRLIVIPAALLTASPLFSMQKLRMNPLSTKNMPTAAAPEYRKANGELCRAMSIGVLALAIFPVCIVGANVDDRWDRNTIRHARPRIPSTDPSFC